MKKIRLQQLCLLGLSAQIVACQNAEPTPAPTVELSAADQEPVDLPSPAPGTETVLPHGAAELKALHPDARLQITAGRVRRVSGLGTRAATAKAASKEFLRESSAALGIQADDLSVSTSTGVAGTPEEEGLGVMFNPATGKYKFRLYSYDQNRDGVPVFGGELRVLVREGDEATVVWANPDLRVLGDFKVPADFEAQPVSEELSLQAIQKAATDAAATPPSALGELGAASSIIFAGIGDEQMPPRMALRYTAEDSAGEGHWTLVADAATGEVLHVESHRHFNINGTVQAEVIQGPDALHCGALEVAGLPYAKVSSPVGNAVADASGAFTIVQSGSAATAVSSNLEGEYFRIIDASDNPVMMSLVVTPPGPADFVHADPEQPPELILAQLNAYKKTSELREMLLTHVPNYPVISQQTNFPIFVNKTEFTCEMTGGAWYDDAYPGGSINFCQRTDTRANTAMGSIVLHEYGHHIVESGGSGQLEYGEGMADTVAMLFAKDPDIGVGFDFDCNEPLRHADSQCSYLSDGCSDCGIGRYECGSVISGTVWDIWQNLEIVEPAQADSIIRSLVLNSIPLHTGTNIDPSIAVDMLTLDDDDEIIENGTPHYAQICDGFAAHGMNCPALLTDLVVKSDDLKAEGPSDGPFAPASASYTLYNLGPRPSLNYSVTTTANWLSVSDASGSIALGEKKVITVTINQTAAAALGDGSHNADLVFTNQSTGVGNVTRVATVRVGAPVPVYTETFQNGLSGYTVGDELGNLWHVSTACKDSSPGHSTGGSLYYGRDDYCRFNTGNPGVHTVVSPLITVENPTVTEIGFNYVLETQNTPGADRAEVLASVNGGPFVVIASNNSGGEKLNETSAWTPLRFDISQLFNGSGPSTIRLQMTFDTGDIYDNNKTGFVMDDITVYALPKEESEGPFLEANGQVVFEAEHFESNTPRSAHSWDSVANAQASGQFVMKANPNSGQTLDTNYVATSPQLNFPVQFTSTGTYYVWVRGSGPSANDDSCHVGLGGAAVSSADRISTFTSNLGWSRATMDGPLATLQVSQAGLRNINLWMREDGFSVDKIVLTKNQNFVPTGTGPAESDRQSLPEPECAHHSHCIDNDPCTSDICDAGFCRNPDNGSCASQTPCAAYCANPVIYGASNYQSGNLGTNATCHETTAALHGGVCGNFVSPRKLFVNGMEMTCNWNNWTALPAAVHGGYCIQTTAGANAWAAFTTW